MPHSPAFTAVLFGLRGCLVDFGARCHAPGGEPVEPTPGALQALHWLQQQGVPRAWLDEAPAALAAHLSLALPAELIAPVARSNSPWPAPDACWQALMQLKTAQLDGCVLVSGEPRLLQAGLNAGLWTVGLASCGSLCGVSAAHWQALDERERELKRGKATLHLFSLGVHSVIDQLEQLTDCLADITQRRLKGEKP